MSNDLSLHIISCPLCHKIVSGSLEEHACPRCQATLRQRKSNSKFLCLIYLITAIIFYLPANIYPIMVVEILNKGNPSTIISGIILFYEEGMYFIGSVILVASVLIPLFKMLGLTYLLFSKSKNDQSRKRKTKLYHIIEFIGKWSMIDIFVICILSGVVDVGVFAKIQSGLGAIFFTAVVILTVLAAKAYDPRLIWDEVQTHE